MCDFIDDGSTVNRPNNAQEIYLKELGSESPMLVRLIMKSIPKQNKRCLLYTSLIGGVKVYGKFSSGDPDTSKTAASWFGACIFLIVAATILRSFFL